jgi:hypothetical protein
MNVVEGFEYVLSKRLYLIFVFDRGCLLLRIILLIKAIYIEYLLGQVVTLVSKFHVHNVFLWRLCVLIQLNNARVPQCAVDSALLFSEVS